MEELREKIARTLAGRYDDWPKFTAQQRGAWLDAADEVLAIPELQKALKLAEQTNADAK